mmetsp:Transcript_90675/g.219937  ORF Transcript_90675/g.219937 Transcript_90675/m.219937 type:complete len:202 (-) Transcript_90675:388-993(-)
MATRAAIAPRFGSARVSGRAIGGDNDGLVLAPHHCVPRVRQIAGDDAPFEDEPLVGGQRAHDVADALRLAHAREVVRQLRHRTVQREVSVRVQTQLIRHRQARFSGARVCRHAHHDHRTVQQAHTQRRLAVAVAIGVGQLASSVSLHQRAALHAGHGTARAGIARRRQQVAAQQHWPRLRSWLRLGQHGGRQRLDLAPQCR